MIEDSFNAALLHHQAGRLQVAEQIYRQILALQPDHAGAIHYLAVIAHQVGKNDIALSLIHRVLALQPNYSDAYSLLGMVLRAQGQLDESIIAQRKAITLDPGNANAYSNLGSALKARGQIDEAITALRRAITLNPALHKEHSNLVYTLCFHIGESAQSVYREARRWNELHASRFAGQIRPWSNISDPDRPLRIGYVSPNLRQHTNGLAMLPLLKAHDRSGYHVVCYSDAQCPDSITEQCKNAADGWRNILGQSDDEVADLVRQDRIDILVDLVSHMADSRLLVFARKPAPVQVTFLGHQSTSGLDTMDYRLSDRHIDPPGLDEEYYTEEIVRLPDCYLVFEPLPYPTSVGPAPALKAGHVTFGSLNNFCKVNQSVLDLWSRILEQLPDSEMILRCPAGEAQQHVLDVFAQRGIAADRLRLYSNWLGPDQYLQLHHGMDIYLDPFPHSGHTTSMDALWMGVPLITLAGEIAVGRGGVFLLANLDLDELIARNQPEYLAKAVELARDLPRLTHLRASLRQRMQQSPLMDAPKYARNIEAAYRQMWRAWCETTPHN